jgi:hypothetical protein
MLRGIHVKLLDFPWNNIIIFVLRIWWTESTCPWTMWGMVHGGPATMASTELGHGPFWAPRTCRGRWEGRGQCRDSVLLLTGDWKVTGTLLNEEVRWRRLEFAGAVKEERRRRVGDQNG